MKTQWTAVVLFTVQCRQYGNAKTTKMSKTIIRTTVTALDHVLDHVATGYLLPVICMIVQTLVKMEHILSLCQVMWGRVSQHLLCRIRDSALLVFQWSVHAPPCGGPEGMYVEGTVTLADCPFPGQIYA